MLSRYYLIGIFLLISKIVFAQNYISNNLKEDYYFRKTKAIEYAIANNLPIRQVYSDGTIIEIQYLDESGKPQYFKTFNSEAAFTTGTNKLYVGSDLGLNLSGKGIKVGIWDGGLVRATHVEFENRAQIVEGSSVSGHATHVTGTILAKGINPAAKGMAFEANSVNYDGLNGDNSEMRVEAENGLLLSNHSYGSVLGWNYNSSNGSWQWYGDVSISNQEDYRFGYYSGAAAIWDEISYNNPNYLIVKSAGNDRTDTGDGNGPPPDGPYDIIGPQGIAKNVLTVGSVNSLSTEYTSPSDVSQAPYSSWGPTDDGRIKPDIVGMGQNVFSTSSTGDDQYNTLSGTSMASPNVTGSLALLQQQYFQQHHSYLTASALKALIIHTAHETGVADGPDYQYGWGLLNMSGASKMLLLDGKDGYFIKYDSLMNLGTSTLMLDMLAGQSLTATLVWTDPAGEPETVAAVDPQDLKLVNDLDIRITDESGTEYFPWVMNPETKQASKADNFRDNVEKIEFMVPTEGTYTLSISHKGELLNGTQKYALIVSEDNINERLKSFYFIGDSPDFLSPTNWSDESGGASINQVPDKDDIIIFDDNSIGILPQSTITIPMNFSCFSFASSGTAAFNLDLNSDTLFVQSNISISNSNFQIMNGVIGLVGNDVFSSINVEPESILNTNLLVLDSNYETALLSDISIDTISIKNGKFNSNSFNIDVSAIIIENSEVKLGATRISNLNEFKVSGLTSSSEEDKVNLVFDGSAINKHFIGGNYSYASIKAVSNELSISELSKADSVIIESSLILLDSCIMNTLVMSGSTKLNIADETELVIEEDLVINSESGNRVEISNYSTGAATNPVIRSEKNPKLCFDFVDISNVQVIGNTNFVVGSNSTLANSNGWIQGACQDILASNFTYEFTCTGGLTYFTDISDGTPDSWEWDFGDMTATSNEVNPQHSFTEIGTYLVTLTVTQGTESSTYSAPVAIDVPNLGIPTIVLEGDQLRSTSFADNYQWYLDNQIIPGETDYFLTNFSAPGAYHVEIWNNNCRLVSEPFVISGINSVPMKYNLFPNPFKNEVIIQSGYSGQMTVIIRDSRGEVVFSDLFIEGRGIYSVNTSNLKSGIYIVEIRQKNYRNSIRLLKI